MGGLLVLCEFSDRQNGDFSLLLRRFRTYWPVKRAPRIDQNRYGSFHFGREKTRAKDVESVLGAWRLAGVGIRSIARIKQRPFEMQPLTFEELAIGNVWTSPTRLITNDDLLEFANLTGDHDRLHTDAEYAANTPFGKPIAHGLLGLSFMAGLSSHHPLVQTTALVSIQEWSFLKPIFVGDSIRVMTRIVDLQEHGRRNGEVRWFRQVLNQLDQVVQQGGLTTLVARAVKYHRVDAASATRPPLGLSVDPSKVL